MSNQYIPRREWLLSDELKEAVINCFADNAQPDNTLIEKIKNTDIKYDNFMMSGRLIKITFDDDNCFALDDYKTFFSVTDGIRHDHPYNTELARKLFHVWFEEYCNLDGHKWYVNKKDAA